MAHLAVRKEGLTHAPHFCFKWYIHRLAEHRHSIKAKAEALWYITWSYRVQRKEEGLGSETRRLERKLMGQK
jgi:hypothetical protein